MTPQTYRENLDAYFAARGLKGDELHADATWPRQVAMALAVRHCGASHRDVGLQFGRDRTTVIHAVKAVKKRLTDPRHVDLTRRQVAEIHGGAMA
ncbi:MAG: helix-turn-helix domain-containing protein [Pseudomonadota bacterium]